MEYLSRAARDGLLKRYKPSELVRMVLDNPQAHFNDSTASRFAKGVAAADKIVNKGLAPLKIWAKKS